MKKASLVQAVARIGALFCVPLVAMLPGACSRGADPVEQVGEEGAAVAGCGQWYLPVAGDRADGCVRSGAGDTTAPGNSHVAGGLCAAPGAEVVAVADGVVSYASWYKPCESWAYLLLIEHALADGDHVCSLYGQVKPLATITVGTPVVGGEIVGKVHRSEDGEEQARFGIYRGRCPAWATTMCPAHGHLPESSFQGEHVDLYTFVAEVCPEL